MENSHIEWCDSTFNPWWGCTKVSAGCRSCYAETLDHRYHSADPHWGLGSNRKMQSENYWKQPFKWNKEAMEQQKEIKVFCASMADVFEDHPDVKEARARLWDTIVATPFLTWQLLTKRPENVLKLWPHYWGDWIPQNVWLGATAENQEMLDERLPILAQFIGTRFLSCEPLLGPIHDIGVDCNDGSGFVDLIIIGGESGHGARWMNLDWARRIRDQCAARGVAFFMKQITDSKGRKIPFEDFPIFKSDNSQYLNKFMQSN